MLSGGRVPGGTRNTLGLPVTGVFFLEGEIRQHIAEHPELCLGWGAVGKRGLQEGEMPNCHELAAP